jgi:signal transduction histidine kinase
MMRELLETLNPDLLDLTGDIATAFFENPFLELHSSQLVVRFGHRKELSDVVGDLCQVGVLLDDGNFVRLSVADGLYTQLVDWVGAQRGHDEVLRQEVVAFEALARLRGKLAVSQEEVSSILEMVPVGVILLDHLGQVLKANSLAEKLTFGWAAIGDHLGVALEALHTRPFETELDGQPPVAVTTRPFQVAGSDTGVVVVIQDITSKRQMAAQAEQLREDFFSMIRHELRKPLLTVERSLAQLGEAEGEAPLALARSATDHLGAMIDDMLFLARLERDPLAVVLDAEVSLRFLLAGCDLAFRQKAAQSHITFNVNFPDEDVLFLADERRLQQVLGNLVDNAFKFTPPGGQVLLAGLIQDEQIHFTVSDSGPGVPADEREQIFGKFYQIRSDAARKPGLGLGLAISQEVVQAHGGEIVVGESEWGGALMKVIVPVNRSDKT